jgi:hypothetical protein
MARLAMTPTSYISSATVSERASFHRIATSNATVTERGSARSLTLTLLMVDAQNFVLRAQLTTLNRNAVCRRSNSVKRPKFGEVTLL